MSLSDLELFSAELGREPHLTQGAGGNTSLKREGSLFVKASGKWLANALSEPIFVELDLALLSAAVRARKEGPFMEFQRDPRALRPSIEAPMHAIIPHRVVIHVHSVRTLSYAVQKDARSRIAQQLGEFKWTWIPYVKPGWPLAFAIGSACGPEFNVWILQNHGLIVAADSVEEAKALLHRVELALGPVELPARRAAGPTRGPARLANYQQVREPRVEALACDHDYSRLLDAGVLYPDFAVYLGTKLAVVQSEDEFLREAQAQAPAIIWRHHGVFLRDGSPPEVIQMLIGHSLLGGLLPAHADLVPLHERQVQELLDWDAEKYRQALSRERS